MSRVAIIAGIKGTTPDPTNADSIPPTSFFDSSWSCEEWMQWTQANINTYGKDVAVQKFVQYASQVSSLSSAHFCPYGSTFYNYYANLGVNFDNIFASTSAATQSVIQTADTTAQTVAQNAGSTISNASNVLSWLIPVALIGGTAYLGYTYLYKPTQKISGIKKRKKYKK